MQSRDRRRWLAFALPLACPWLALAQIPVVQGRVVSSTGLAVPAAHVTLRCSADPHRSKDTLTDADGIFRFEHLSSCDFVLRIQAENFAPAADRPIHIENATGGPLQENVTLQAVSAGSPQASRPVFQAAGIRGLIDPGGYSASASAAAATNVLTDVSGLQGKGAAHDPSSAKPLDCAQLLRMEQVVREHPDDPSGQAEVGSYLLHHGDPSAAMPYLNHAVSLNPSNLHSRLDLADAQIRTGKFQDAVATLASIEAPGPDRSRYDELKARAAQGLGQFDEAVQHYRMLEEESPTEDHVFALAYASLLAGHTADAQHTLLDGLQRYPVSVTLRVGIGAVYFFQRDFEQSIRFLLQAGDLNPSDPRPYPLLTDVSSVYDRLDGPVQAAMERHVSLMPNDAGGYAALGAFLLQCHTAAAEVSANQPSSVCDTDKAERLLLHAVQLSPNLSAAHSALATLYQRQGKFAKQVEQLVVLSKLDPDNKQIRYRLGLAYKRNGQRQESEKEMRAVQGLTAREPSDESRFAQLLSAEVSGTDQRSLTSTCASRE